MINVPTPLERCFLASVLFCVDGMMQIRHEIPELANVSAFSCVVALPREVKLRGMAQVGQIDDLRTFHNGDLYVGFGFVNVGQFLISELRMSQVMTLLRNTRWEVMWHQLWHSEEPTWLIP